MARSIIGYGKKGKKGKKGKGKKGKKGKGKKGGKKIKGFSGSSSLEKAVEKKLAKSTRIKELENLRARVNFRKKNGSLKVVAFTDFSTQNKERVIYIPHIDAIVEQFSAENVVIHEASLLPLLKDYSDLPKEHVQQAIATLALAVSGIQSQCKSKKEVEAIRKILNKVEECGSVIVKQYQKKVVKPLEKEAAKIAKKSRVSESEK